MKEIYIKKMMNDNRINIKICILHLVGKNINEYTNNKKRQ